MLRQILAVLLVSLFGACSQALPPCIPQAEVCDGKDNNCDGQIDENLTRACATDCGKGTETCQDGKWGNCTAPKPQTEICDGKDNNCDGQIDENLTRACATDCGKGTETCQDGKWGGCTAPKPQTEICDGKDNNCDGRIDEGCPCTHGRTSPCYTGPAYTRGQGMCKDGLQICSKGTWGPCGGEVLPVPEVCDGKDNDCDGVVDNSLTRACATDCGKGTETCQDGKWGGCTAPKPQTEICGNGKDDDCDGVIDESCQCLAGKWQTCYTAEYPLKGECKAGSHSCDEWGRWGKCLNETLPQPEICGNGKDDDCNGVVDDGCPGLCKPGEKRTCYTGARTKGGRPTQDRGICKAGTQTCQADGSWPSKCEGEVLPKPQEDCGNGKDDDCDGLIDGCECTPLVETDNCYNGPQGTAGKGACKVGTRACESNGQWGACQGQILPADNEICDGIDNNCNSVVDEKTEKACTTKCGTPGTKKCAAQNPGDIGRYGPCESTDCPP